MNDKTNTSVTILERDGRHQPYLTYDGGFYDVHQFNDSTMSITFKCGMVRFNYDEYEENNHWKERNKLCGVPDEFLQFCDGSFMVVVNTPSGMDEIRLLKSHICGCATALTFDTPTQRFHNEVKVERDEMGVGKESVSDKSVVKKIENEKPDANNLQCFLQDTILDDRPPICFFTSPPDSQWLDKKDTKQLKLMMESGIPNLWNTLVGGRFGPSNKRMFTPNLADFDDIHNVVKKCMSGFIGWVQKQYPALQHYKLAVLKTYPGAKSQYAGCNHRLHSDYGEKVNTRPPSHRPISLMVAIDEFELMYMMSRNDRRRDIINQLVYPGQAVMFTNYCLHAGGQSTSKKVCYRMFAYMVSDPNDLPDGQVYYYTWKSTNDDELDDVIKGSTRVNVSIEKPDMDMKLERVRNSKGRLVKNTNYKL